MGNATVGNSVAESFVREANDLVTRIGRTFATAKHTASALEDVRKVIDEKLSALYAREGVASSDDMQIEEKKHGE